MRILLVSFIFLSFSAVAGVYDFDRDKGLDSANKLYGYDGEPTLDSSNKLKNSSDAYRRDSSGTVYDGDGFVVPQKRQQQKSKYKRNQW
jgi:hypothetical protein